MKPLFAILLVCAGCASAPNTPPAEPHKFIAYDGSVIGYPNGETVEYWSDGTNWVAVLNVTNANGVPFKFSSNVITNKDGSIGCFKTEL